jgi:hypothetical protein
LVAATKSVSFRVQILTRIATVTRLEASEFFQQKRKAFTAFSRMNDRVAGWIDGFFDGRSSFKTRAAASEIASTSKKSSFILRLSLSIFLPPFAARLRKPLLPFLEFSRAEFFGHPFGKTPEGLR